MPDHDMSQEACIKRAEHFNEHIAVQDKFKKLDDIITRQWDMFRLLNKRCNALHEAIKVLQELVELNENQCKERSECSKRGY